MRVLTRASCPMRPKPPQRAVQIPHATSPRSAVSRRWSHVTRCCSPLDGFTLIELALVAAVLGILLAAAVPRFLQTSQRLRAEQTAFELTQLLRYARERAVVQGRTVVWVWDPSARRWHLEVEAEEGQAAGRMPLADRVARSQVLMEGLEVHIGREEIPVNDIRFFPDGTSEPARLLLTHQDYRYTVTVDAPTGQIHLSTGPAPR